MAEERKSFIRLLPYRCLHQLSLSTFFGDLKNEKIIKNWINIIGGNFIYLILTFLTNKI